MNWKVEFIDSEVKRSANSFPSKKPSANGAKTPNLSPNMRHWRRILPSPMRSSALAFKPA